MYRKADIYLETAILRIGVTIAIFGKHCTFRYTNIMFVTVHDSTLFLFERDSCMTGRHLCNVLLKGLLSFSL